MSVRWQVVGKQKSSHLEEHCDRLPMISGYSGNEVLRRLYSTCGRFHRHAGNGDWHSGRPGLASRVSSLTMILCAGSGAKRPTSDTSAETVTVWFSKAMSENWILSVRLSSSASVMVRVMGAKPGNSAVRRYSPASRLAKKN